MLIANYILLTLIVIGFTTIYFCNKKKVLNVDINLMIKVLCYVLIVVFFFRYMLNNEAIQYTFKLVNDVFESKAINVYVLILNWLINASILLVCMYPFFKDVKGINAIIKYFVLPVSILYVGSYFLMAKAVVGANVFTKFSTRSVLMVIECTIMLFVSFVVFMENGKFKLDKTDSKALLYIIPMLVFSVPAYLVQGLFGYYNSTIEIKGLTVPHRILLYGSIILPIILYFLLNKKDERTKKLSVLYISLATLISFSYTHRFGSFANVTGWPLHLCNTAMYIIPLCLIFKMDKLFYFTYFINVLGAFLAMAMPNFSSSTNLFSSACIVFFINHYVAFYMPLLIVALRIYKRPKLKEFKYSIVGFFIYFALVLICNAWFSNYGNVDYFFINSDFIADKLGKWAEDLRKIVLAFNIGNLKFVFYPVYQALFFVVYCILGACMWFLYEGSYNFVDTLQDIAKRKEKIKLDQLALEVALSGRGKDEPMDLENQNKIILKDFSKRYGKSSVYAVKDANIEIVGGEIFGFLGHNGAGKSTIIKSIVGIQPITSGSIQVCGYDVDKQSALAKKNIGYVPDHYALYEKLTGREYINYIADLYNVSTKDRDERICKYVKLFELENAFDNQIKTYSHGMKQKIAIMSALVHNPKVWILDEPLTGLDPSSIFQVKECMREHAKAGNIVFFSSHLIDIVEQLCDRIAIIKKGKILISKKVSDIEKETTLEKFYLDITNTQVEESKVGADDTAEVVANKKMIKNKK